MSILTNSLTSLSLTRSPWAQLQASGSYRLINTSNQPFPRHLTRLILRAGLATLWHQLCPTGVVCRAPRQHNNLIVSWLTTDDNHQTTITNWLGVYLFGWQQSQPTTIDFHAIAAVYDYPVLLTTSNHNLSTIIPQLQAETYAHPWTIITAERINDSVVEFSFQLVPTSDKDRLQPTPLTYLQVMTKEHLLQVLAEYTTQHPEWSLAQRPWASANKKAIINTLVRHWNTMDKTTFQRLYNQQLLRQQQNQIIPPVMTWLPPVP